MQVEFVADVEGSRALNQVRSGAVIISASGMCDAGRIKYHLRENLPRSECSVLITGFQAAGSLGRRLVDGARLVAYLWRAGAGPGPHHTVGGLSAHADQAELLHWLRGFHTPPQHAFVVHGEAAASAAFAQAIHDQLGWPMPRLPFMGERINL
jgi:metallo-beta-lactamase family protein